MASVRPVAVDPDRRPSVGRLDRRRPSAAAASAIRSIGRERMLASPVSSNEPACPARMPGQEPDERPGVSDVDRLGGGLEPAQADAVHDSSVSPAPLDLDAERLDGRDVESVSAEAPNPRTCTDPDEIAPTRTARWLTDLSPGTASSPVSPPAGPMRRPSSLMPRPPASRPRRSPGRRAGRRRAGPRPRRHHDDRRAAGVRRHVVELEVLDVDALCAQRLRDARRARRAGRARARGRDRAPRAPSRRPPRAGAGGCRPPRRSSGRGSPRPRARARAPAPRPRRPCSRRPSSSASRLSRKMSTQIRGLAPATRVMSRNEPPTAPSGSWPSTRPAPAWFARTFATRVRQMARDRHEPVVGAGVDRDRPSRRAPATKPCTVRWWAGSVAASRRQEPGRALEEVGARVRDAASLRAAHRMAADEARRSTRPPRPAATSSSRRRSRRSRSPVAATVCSTSAGRWTTGPHTTATSASGNGVLERRPRPGPPHRARGRRGTASGSGSNADDARPRGPRPRARSTRR